MLCSLKIRQKHYSESGDGVVCPQNCGCDLFCRSERKHPGVEIEFGFGSALDVCGLAKAVTFIRKKNVGIWQML